VHLVRFGGLGLKLCAAARLSVETSVSNPSREHVSPAQPDERRRRAIYRATYRGTKEMDWLIGRYAAAKVPSMSDIELSLFEQVLVIPDPDLHAWIIDPAPIAHSPFAGLIADVRAFHDLDTQTDSV
jgi:antitoxin CptB